PTDEFTLELPNPNVAPANTTAPAISGVTHVGGTLACTTGEWTGKPEPTYAYEWQRDGAQIGGAEGPSYTTTIADGGHKVRCVVTATNVAGSASAPSVPVTVQPATCTGGPIAGLGSALQGPAQNALWIPGYGAVCGAGHEVAYESTTSAAALGAWGFDGGPFDHTKAFLGTDEPPTAAQIKASDTASGTHALVIPVAQTAIAIVANPPANCQIEEITNKQLESVMRGNIKIWNKVQTASGAGCVNAPITRVVRADASGT